jgi:TPP-dependent 2-oxoacid decarboxylase
LATAAAEIDRVLTACVVKRQPVYIDLSVDVVEAVLPNQPQHRTLTIGSIRDAMVNPPLAPACLPQTVSSIVDLILRAVRPVIIVGQEFRTSKFG